MMSIEICGEGFFHKRDIASHEERCFSKDVGNTDYIQSVAMERKDDMPTIEDRLARLAELDEKLYESQLNLFNKRHILSDRARKLLVLYQELRKRKETVPAEFIYVSHKNPYGFFLLGDGLLVTVGKDTPALFRRILLFEREKKYVAVLSLQPGKIDDLFHLEEWSGSSRLIYGLGCEYLEELDKKLSEFEKRFYDWFDAKFGATTDKMISYSIEECVACAEDEATRDRG